MHVFECLPGGHLHAKSIPFISIIFCRNHCKNTANEFFVTAHCGEIPRKTDFLILTKNNEVECFILIPLQLLSGLQ